MDFLRAFFKSHVFLAGQNGQIEVLVNSVMNLNGQQKYYKTRQKELKILAISGN